MKFIAQMVGKNEADRYLVDVLEHLRNIVDEIVFTDDGSDDDTYEIAKSYDCHTYRNDHTLFTENEGELRQVAWHNLENHATEGDWILAIDCDEKLFQTQRSVWDLFNEPYQVLGVKFYHMWNQTQYRVDKEWKPNISSRLFKYHDSGVFADRRLACGSEPQYVQEYIKTGKFLPNTGLVMQHLGYIRDEDKQAKHERYSILDGGKFHANTHIESILDTSPRLVDWTFV